MQCLLRCQGGVEPAVRVFAADGHGPAVVDVDHAAEAVGRHQHETRFFAAVLVRAELGQRQQEQGRAVLAVDVPRLLAAFFSRPFIPAMHADDAASRAQQGLPVGPGKFFQAGVDGDGDFFLAGRGHGLRDPGGAVAPEDIVDPVHAILDMQHGPVSAGRHVQVRLGLAVEHRVGPAER
ncbi:hypothetical protein D3C81_1469610 [compost metagenome]